jgi:hypothetical protein
VIVRDPSRRAAWLLIVGLLAPVLVAVALTVSIYGAVYGLPLLSLVGPPWWRSINVARQRRSFTPGTRTHAVLAVAILSVIALGAAAVGLNDIDTAEDVALCAVGLIVLGLLWRAALLLVRLRTATDDENRHR